MENQIEEILEQRKGNIAKFLKEKKEWVIYTALAIIVWISMFIRSRNIPKLKDITTNDWTLGPDLDPYLFLRWAKEIVKNGSLMAIDTMRYVPEGFNTAYEMKLLPYLLAWFHNFLAMFGFSDSVTYSAIIFPVFMAGLTAIAFFLFARKVFYKQDKITRNIIALISTLFFVLVPSLLPRTIAGIPEKESAAFFFMFLAFYLFLEAYTSENFKKYLGLGILSGIVTGLMGLIWGGYVFVFITISVAVLFSFIFGKVKEREFLIYSSWLAFSVLTMIPFSTRYSLKFFINAMNTNISFVVFALLGISLFIMKFKKFGEYREKTKIPKQIFALIVSAAILVVLVSLVLGPMFILGQIDDVKDSLITPMTTRFGLTVAENKQPFFINDWKGSFGPNFSGIPLYFWLFFIGSIVLFNSMIRKLLKREKIILTFSYFIFLVCLIFSRYSPNSVLNGTSKLSLLVYFGGWIFFLGTFAYFYYKRYQEGGFSIFKEFNFAYILYFIILTLGIIGARGGIRLIMVLGAVSPIAVAFLIVAVSKKYFSTKDDTMKIFFTIVAILILLASIFTAWSYYKSDKYTAENFALGGYQWQWQKAMSWVRDNTPTNAVFAHWWDYGYWVQSIGERATILDGSNSIIYWNHLMGRHVLTGTNEMNALEFLYAHNGTHFLVDSTEIGKYTAYSSIGADENYDRFSWISTFHMDETQTLETKNEVAYVYGGGSVTDGDIIFNLNGKEIFIPEKAGAVAGIILRRDVNEKISQPEAVFIYNNQQINIPLRYAYYQNELHDFNSGLEAGIFVYPSARIENNQISYNPIGSLLYLSEKTINSQLARLYLFDEKSDYFKLAHTESNLIVEDFRQQGLNTGEFLQYQGFQGPIKIWEIDYPSNIKFKPEYLEKSYPNENLRLAQSGKY